MFFRKYYRSLKQKERQSLADSLDTTTGYLGGIAWGHKKPGALMCNKIEQATGGEVTRESLRPDIFSKADAEAA